MVAVIHKNEPYATGNSKKVVQPWTKV